MKRPIFSLAALAVLLGVAHAQVASFRGLGHLPGMELHSEARAVSADGSTVVGYSDGLDAREAFRWTEAGGMQGLGDLPGGESFSQAFAVSSDGSVVVGVGVSDSGNEAFRWAQAGGIMGLGNLPGSIYGSRATGISADGSLIVGTGNYCAGGGPLPVTGEAFRCTGADDMVGLGDVPGGTGVSRAYGVSADGSTIVGKGNADARNSFFEDSGVAFRYTAAEGMVPLGFLPGGSELSVATAVSGDGSVVVGFSDYGLHIPEAFRWTAGDGMVALGSLPDFVIESRAYAVAADGSVVVGTSCDKAFIWDQTHRMRDLAEVLIDDLGLDLTGWELEEATGISADGRVIVGNGRAPSGLVEPWRAVIPEPGSFVLLTTGLLLVAVYRGRSRPARARPCRRARSALTGLGSVTVSPDSERRTR